MALTAALAGAGGALSACGSDPVSVPAGSGGSGNTGGSAGNGGKGSATGGTAGRSAATGGSGGATGGSGGTTGGSGGATGGSGGSAGKSGGGGGGTESGGTSGTNASGGSSAGESSGGTAGTGGIQGQAGEDAGGMGGEGGESAEGGAGGVPNDDCRGDVGISDCSGLGLPVDECTTLDFNQVFRSCTFSAGTLRPGVLEALGSCLASIEDASCTLEAEAATYGCETAASEAACPAPAAADACANGVTLQNGPSVESPLDACSDGTLTLGSCTTLLNAVNPDVLFEVVKCADPAGEYGPQSTGTCVERLHHCVFPRANFYVW